MNIVVVLILVMINMHSMMYGAAHTTGVVRLKIKKVSSSVPPTSMNPEFKKAIEDGDVKAVTNYLAKDPNAIAAVYEEGGTPLMLAVLQLKLLPDLFKVLLEKAPQSQLKSLILKSMKDSIQGVAILVNRSSDDKLALEIIKMLLDRVPDLMNESFMFDTFRPKDRVTILEEAVRTYNTALVRLLFQYKNADANTNMLADPYDKNSVKAPLLSLLLLRFIARITSYTSSYDNRANQTLPIIKILVEHGALVTGDAQKYLQELKEALQELESSKDDVEIFLVEPKEFLLKKGKEIVDYLEDVITKKMTKEATQEALNPHMIKELISAVQEFAVGSSDSRKVVMNQLKGIIRDSLDEKKKKAALESLQELIKKDATYLLVGDQAGYTALHSAVYARSLDVIDAILKKDVLDSKLLKQLLQERTGNNDTQESSRLTPLELAQHLNYKDVVERLKNAQQALATTDTGAGGKKDTMQKTPAAKSQRMPRGLDESDSWVLSPD